MLSDLETGLSSQPENQRLEKQTILKIDIDDIIPNEKNIMSTDDIDELAESIRKDGLLNPLKVYRNSNGTFELFGGHRRYMALKKIIDEDEDFDFEVNCIVYKRPESELRERMQIIQDNAQRDMSNEDKRKVFEELSKIFDEAEAEDNVEITGRKPKSEWISINLGLSQRTIQRWLKDESKKEATSETEAVEAPQETEKKESAQTEENPDAPSKEEIKSAKEILSSKFEGASVSKSKITIPFDDRFALHDLIEELTGQQFEE